MFQAKWAALAVLAALALAAPAAADIQAQQVSPESIGAPPAPDSIVVTTPYVCYHTGTPSPLNSTWGTYPYQQKVYETRNWCGYLNDYQTWRSSSVQLGSTLCSNHDPSQQLTAGGNGYFYATVLSAGKFDCPTNIPWIAPHPHDWQKWRCNMAGYCAFVDAGRF